MDHHRRQQRRRKRLSTEPELSRQGRPVLSSSNKTAKHIPTKANQLNPSGLNARVGDRMQGDQVTNAYEVNSTDLKTVLWQNRRKQKKMLIDFIDSVAINEEEFATQLVAILNRRLRNMQPEMPMEIFVKLPPGMDDEAIASQILGLYDQGGVAPDIHFERALKRDREEERGRKRQLHVEEDTFMDGDRAKKFLHEEEDDDHAGGRSGKVPKTAGDDDVSISQNRLNPKEVLPPPDLGLEGQTPRGAKLRKVISESDVSKQPQDGSEKGDGDKKGNGDNNRSNRRKRPARRRRANNQGAGGSSGGSSPGASGGAGGDDRRDGGDDKRKRNQKPNEPKEREEQEEGKEKEEKDKEQAGFSIPVQATPAIKSQRFSRSVDNRNGISIKGYSKKGKRKGLNPKAKAQVKEVYSEHTQIRNFSQELNLGNLPVLKLRPRRRRPKMLENLPLILASELSESQILEIQSIKRTKKGLRQWENLMDKYEENQNAAAYLALMLSHQHFLITDYAEEKKIKDKLAIYSWILATPAQRKRLKPISLEQLREALPKRFNDKGFGAVFTNMQDIAALIEELAGDTDDQPADFESVEKLKSNFKHIEEALKDNDSQHQLKALSDYANFLFQLYADVMEHPWDIIHDEFSVAKSKDNAFTSLLILYAAQLALESEPVHNFDFDGPLYRWETGLSAFAIGDVLSPQALYSTSTGTRSSEAYGGNEDRTLFIIRKSKTGKLIQLLAGPKYWYQREVLFPTYAQFIIRDKRVVVNENSPEFKEVWYVIDELDVPVQQVYEDQVGGIGLLDSDAPSPIPEDFLAVSLVDLAHQKLLEEGNWQKLQDEVEGLEGRNQAEITLRNLYGPEIHERWNQLMRLGHPRRQLLTEATLLAFYAQLMGIKKAKYRTEQRGWGESGDTFTLNAAQREALTENGIFFYATIPTEQQEAYKNWVAGHKFRKKADLGIHQNQNQQEYIKELEGRMSNGEVVYVLMDAKARFMQEKYRTELDRDNEPVEVVYDTPENFSTAISARLNEISTHLEQSLALLRNRQLTLPEYVQNIRQHATRLQQYISAIHPFNDGNGRLSRLMMYKVLQAYSPTDLGINALPLIRDTSKDQTLGAEDWYLHVFGNNKTKGPVSFPRTERPQDDDSSSGEDSSSADDDEGPSGGAKGKRERRKKSKKRDKPTGQFPGVFTETRLTRRGENNGQLNVLYTVGDGNCGIHALFGRRDNYGMIFDRSHKARRQALVDALLSNPEDYRGLYVPLFTELLERIHKGEALNDDDLIFWTNLLQIKGFTQALETALLQAVEGNTELRNALASIKERVARLVLEPTQSHLLEFFVQQILRSNSESGRPIREALKEANGLQEQRTILGHQEEAFLQNLVFENLVHLNNWFNGAGSQYGNYTELVDAYSRYANRAADAEGAYGNLANGLYVDIMKAYANTVAQDAVYLYAEDLRVLAQINGYRLILHHRDDRDRNGRSFVSEAPFGDGQEVHVYHQGLHFRKALLQEE